MSSLIRLMVIGVAVFCSHVDGQTKMESQEFFAEIGQSFKSKHNRSGQGDFSISGEGYKEPMVGEFRWCRIENKELRFFFTVEGREPSVYFDLKQMKTEWRSNKSGARQQLEIPATKSIEGYALDVFQAIVFGVGGNKHEFLYADQMHYRKQIQLPQVHYTLSPKLADFLLERVHFQLSAEGQFQLLEVRAIGGKKRLVLEPQSWSTELFSDCS